MPGILRFRDIARDDAVAQLSDLVLIQVSDRVAQPSRLRLRGGNETVTSELFENPGVIGRQRGLSLALYIDRANCTALC